MDRASWRWPEASCSPAATSVASLALRWDALWLFYLGYGVIGGAGIGFGYVTPVATVAKWFPRPQGPRHRHRRHGVRHRCVAAEHGPGTRPGNQDRERPGDGLLLARHHLRADPHPHEFADQRSTARLRPRCGGGRGGAGGAIARLPDFHRVRDHVAGVLLQHLRRDRGDQLPIIAAAGRLGDSRTQPSNRKSSRSTVPI